MNKFIEEILNILKKDKRLFSKNENKLLKGELISLISKDDEKLLELLASNKAIEKRFFKRVGKITIFQKENFLQLITMNEFLPDSFTAFEVNIGLSNNKKLISSQEDISLVFPHKDCILEGGQDKEDIKREEIFYNTTLAPDEVDRLKEPKVLTNWKKFDYKGEGAVKDISRKDNLVIKGNNLLALYSLLPNFKNTVKLIYIDPPYNTGNDGFKYNDRFNHSTWLTFMKNRLEIARDLLSDDGVIFVQCDDNELSHLKILMDDIFKQASSGKSNFIQYIEIKANVGAANEFQNPFMPKNCEYGLYFAKNYDSRKYKKMWMPRDYDEAYSKIVLNPKEKNYFKWKIGSVKKEIEKEYNLKYEDIPQNKINEFVIKNSSRIFQAIGVKGAGKGLVEAMKDSEKKIWGIYKRNDREDILCYSGRMVRFYSKNIEEINNKKTIVKELGSLWDDILWNGIANEGGVKLKNGKKPEKLLRRIIEMSTEKNDLVLDFFAGSGTTGAVAHKLNRQYILIEQMDYIHDLPEARLKNVIAGDQTGISKDVNWKGGGNFVYTELLEWNNKYIRDLESAKTKTDIKKIKAKIEKEAFYKYQINTSKFDNKEFDKLSEKEQKEVLIDVLDMNHLYVNLDSINDATFAISKEDKELNKKFYNQK